MGFKSDYHGNHDKLDKISTTHIHTHNTQTHIHTHRHTHIHTPHTQYICIHCIAHHTLFCLHARGSKPTKYVVFNKIVFNSQLPSDLEVCFNDGLRTTAGMLVSLLSHKAAIGLSTKLCNSFVTIRDTLIHEMYHAATWLLGSMRHANHGRAWKKEGRHTAFFSSERWQQTDTCNIHLFW